MLKFCKMTLELEEGVYWRAGSTAQITMRPEMLVIAQGERGFH